MKVAGPPPDPIPVNPRTSPADPLSSKLSRGGSPAYFGLQVWRISPEGLIPALPPLLNPS